MPGVEPGEKDEAPGPLVGGPGALVFQRDPVYIEIRYVIFTMS